MQTPAFEETRPADYLLRHAASDLGKAYKGLAVAELAIRPGDVVLDLGCGPGADLPALAEAAGPGGRVIGIDNDPAAVLAEARQVLRDGGTAVFAEPDWDTLVVDYPDLATARAYTRFITDRVVRNAVLGRQLPRLAAAAGFQVSKVIPVTAVYRDVREADQ